MKNKVLVFDCDGTVLDTFDLIEKIVFSTFKELRPSYPLTLEEAHSFFGPYITDTFKKYVTATLSVDDYVNVYNKYADLYTEKYIKTYRGLNDVLETLQAQGYVLGIASNKISYEVLRGLRICKMEKYFSFIIGAEIMPIPKPNPACLKIAMDRYNVNKCIMIGDTISDIMTGKNAACYTIGVTWCKTTKEEFNKVSPDAVVDSPNELLKAIEVIMNKMGE